MGTVLIVVAAMVVGYMLGRWRPAHRASDWAWWGLGVGRPSWTRKDPRWWLAQCVFAAEIVAMFTTRPRQTITNIRANRAQPQSEPVLVHDTDWATNRKETP